MIQRRVGLHVRVSKCHANLRFMLQPYAVDIGGQRNGQNYDLSWQPEQQELLIQKKTSKTIPRHPAHLAILIGAIATTSTISSRVKHYGALVLQSSLVVLNHSHMVITEKPKHPPQTALHSTQEHTCKPMLWEKGGYNRVSQTPSQPKKHAAPCDTLKDKTLPPSPSAACCCKKVKPQAPQQKGI